VSVSECLSYPDADSELGGVWEGTSIKEAPGIDGKVTRRERGYGPNRHETIGKGRGQMNPTLTWSMTGRASDSR
jgi:hypothetical protein